MWSSRWDVLPYARDAVLIEHTSGRALAVGWGVLPYARDAVLIEHTSRAPTGR